MLQILTILFSVLSQAAPAASDRLVLNEVAGAPDVRVLRRGEESKAEIVRRGAELFVGDVVETAPRQVVTLLAFDGSWWKVAPDSRFKIEARVPQKKQFFQWTFGLEKGAMWGMVKKAESADGKGFRLKVKARNAAMGVRGTEYLLETREAFTGLDVIEGVVWFGNDSGFSPGTYVEVKAGEHAEIGADGSPKKPVPSRRKGAALAVAYGLAPPAKDEQREPNSLEECRIQGKGWESSGGSKMGSCK